MAKHFIDKSLWGGLLCILIALIYALWRVEIRKEQATHENPPKKQSKTVSYFQLRAPPNSRTTLVMSSWPDHRLRTVTM